MGVRRAVDILLGAANDPASPCPVCTDGPLIHNKQVMKLLADKGVYSLQELPPDTSPGTVVIRAHGVSPQHRKDMERVSRRVVNATCPHVMRVQRIVDKYTAQGYEAVIVGDAGHAEVNGILAHARGRGYVVGGPEEVAGLPELTKAIIVAQTTQSHEVFSKTASRI